MYKNGEFFKGRFEFTKDIRAFYNFISTYDECLIEITELHCPESAVDQGAVVTFRVWVGDDFDDNYVRDLLTKLEAHTKTFSDAYKFGIELHVFLGSVDTAKTYTGERNHKFWE
jgi:hypothetical protein